MFDQYQILADHFHSHTLGSVLSQNTGTLPVFLQIHTLPLKTLPCPISVSNTINQKKSSDQNPVYLLYLGDEQLFTQLQAIIFDNNIYRDFSICHHFWIPMNHPEISWDVTRDFPMKNLQAMALGSSRGSETAPWTHGRWAMGMVEADLPRTQMTYF